jgi:hypothetical protein
LPIYENFLLKMCSKIFENFPQNIENVITNFAKKFENMHKNFENFNVPINLKIFQTISKVCTKYFENIPKYFENF